MITTQEIVRKHKVTRQTLNNWIKKDIIPNPSIKKGRQNAWSIAEVKKIEKVIEEKNEEKLNPLKSNIDKLKINNRRYLGSKQKLLDFIKKVVDENTYSIKSVADIFGGTGVVADLFREEGKEIIVNDLLVSNYISYQTWFGTEKVNYNKIKSKLKELNSLEGLDGYVTKNFGNRYFSLENAQKIDAIREQIEVYPDINQREKSFLLTSLLYSMDKVANTVGHYDAYRKTMDSNRPLYLRLPELNINKENQIYNEDANSLVRKIKADLVYIDTPYNSRGYESAYHVLENVMEWKKPAVEGVAKKAVNRSEKSSEYTKSKAPQAFDDLIQNIKAKYILVSYNNMAKKGNSRSNAKISNEEIMASLERRGEVLVFDTDFNAFTTGKSKIKNHKELLYLCVIRDNKTNNKELILQSPLNYTGAKHKLLPQIKPLFPRTYNNFIDLFAGGGSVTANRVKDNIGTSYLMNDLENHVIEFFEYLSKVDINEFVDTVEKTIKKYGLSNSSLKGYSYYNCDSAKGLGEYNKEKFLELRKDYNTNPTPILFYLLVVFGFNNQIRFNAKGEYNLPVGKRDFNNRMKKKLIDFSKALHSNKIHFSSEDFRNVSFDTGDFIYADPPYLISNAAYNENGGWTEKDEKDLYDYLDKANEDGVKFALSNVILHKNKENEILKQWASKYDLQVLNYHYNNSNYQSKARQSETVEVLVRNYVEESIE